MAETRPLRILVIDDDPSVREVLSQLLEAFGYECQTAADGASGLARFDEGRCDVVLTDLVMPEMNGWEVVEKLRQRSSTVPIVVMTGLLDFGVERRAAERGVPLLAKPFGSDTFRAVVTAALQARLPFRG